MDHQKLAEVLLVSELTRQKRCLTNADEVAKAQAHAILALAQAIDGLSVSIEVGLSQLSDSVDRLK